MGRVHGREESGAGGGASDSGPRKVTGGETLQSFAIPAEVKVSMSRIVIL